MDEKIIKKAREKITSDEYGRFDVIELLIPLDDLLDKKPRFIFELVLESLDLNKGDINVISFRQWLRRFRRSKGYSRPKKRESTFKKESSISPTPSGAVQNKNLDFLEDFKITDPSTIKEKRDREDPLIKVIKS